MLLYLFLTSVTSINSVLTAILSAQALPPKNASLTYYSAVLYERPPVSVVQKYRPIMVHCGAALISPKWLITNKNCHVNLKWNVIVGVSGLPRRAIHKKNKYSLNRLISSIGSLLTLLELDRHVETGIAKPVEMGMFIPGKMKCIVLSWMAVQKNTDVLARQLYCNFHYHTAEECIDFANKSQVEFNDTETDICLLQKIKHDPVALCMNDTGAPFVCDGKFVGSVYLFPNTGLCIKENKTDTIYAVTNIDPDVEWIDYFINERISNLSVCCWCSRLYVWYVCVINAIKLLINF